MNSMESKLWSEAYLYEVDDIPGSASTLRPFVFLFVVRDSNEPASSIIVHKRNGDTLPIDTHKNTNLKGYLEASRQEFKAQILKKQLFQRKSTKVTFEIKPYDSETDLEVIQKNLEHKFSCNWVEFDIVPIGFGISKLVAVCVLDGDVDALCGDIEEVEDVQSVDVASIVYV